MRTDLEPRRVWAIALALATLALAAPAALAFNDCNAEIKADLMRTEEKRVEVEYHVKVDVTVREECATFYYELVLEEKLPSGETKMTKKPMRNRMRNGHVSRKVSFSVSRDNQLESWKFVPVECRKCE